MSDPNMGDLRAALAHIDDHGFGDCVDSDAIVKAAAEGLVALFDDLGLDEESAHSAADQCAALYELLCSFGLAVA